MSLARLYIDHTGVVHTTHTIIQLETQTENEK